MTPAPDIGNRPMPRSLSRYSRRWVVPLGVAAVIVLVPLGYFAGCYLIAMYEFSKMMYERDIEDCAIANHRGDELRVHTDVGGPPPFKTVVTLRRADDWFSTTLLNVTSQSLWVDLRWRDDDHAEVAMDFDDNPIVGTPVESVGRVKITYFFGTEYHSPPHHGYEID